MSASSATGGVPEVPAQVFAKFLDVLSATDIPTEVVDRLRKTLLDDRVLTDRALRAAVLSEDTLP